MKWNEMMEHYLALTHPMAHNEKLGELAYVTYKLFA